tara:strand:- start:1321 stop:1518 length:198 start_codon:yes stop_codon:yes gene_type:complete
MDEIDVVQFVQKTIRERRTLVLGVLENKGVKSMEQYQHLMGELDALQHINEELSDMLERQEILDG